MSPASRFSMSLWLSTLSLSPSLSLAAVKAPPAIHRLPLSPAATETLTVSAVARHFERFDRELKSLSADFRQLVKWDESDATQTVEGAVHFRKPDLFRIEHRLPEPQTLVADGKWLWIHRRSTNQVIQTRFEDWRKSDAFAQGLLDFGNYSALLKSYDVALSSVQPPGPDGHRDFSLVLRPKGKAKDFMLTLRLSTRDYFPADTELRANQIVVHSVFTNIRYNPTHPDERFQFTPPKGADVFQNLNPSKAE